jgi:hypothetical protein
VYAPLVKSSRPDERIGWMRASLIEFGLRPQQGIVGPLLQLDGDPHRLQAITVLSRFTISENGRTMRCWPLALFRLIGMPSRHLSA